MPDRLKHERRVECKRRVSVSSLGRNSAVTPRSLRHRRGVLPNQGWGETPDALQRPPTKFFFFCPTRLSLGFYAQGGCSSTILLRCLLFLVWDFSRDLRTSCHPAPSSLDWDWPLAYRQRLLGMLVAARHARTTGPEFQESKNCPT